MAKVTIKLDGTETTVDLDQNGDVILEAGLTAGLDVPFSCQGGICTTCMAKLDSGTVSMDSNFALSEKEIADGFILTCQARITT